MTRSPVTVLALALPLLFACGGRDREGGSDGGAGGMDGGRRDGAAGETCGSAVCAPGSRCCDHCTGSCVPEASGAFCPDDMSPPPACDAGTTDGATAWTSCAEAHGRARTDDPCTFTDSCGNCCCEGSTSCVSGRITLALCECPCVMSDAGTP